MPTTTLTATTISLLPEPVGLNLIVSGSGLGAWLMAIFAMSRRWPLERVQRAMLFGTISGGTLAAVALFALLLFA